MAKVFNIAAVCRPERHYMVNIDDKLKEIKQLIDDGMYFTINRARQYGKTTTLRALSQYLQNDYYVVLLDFQTFDEAKFQNGHIFSVSFAGSFLRKFKRNKSLINNELQETIDDLKKDMDNSDIFTMKELFEGISDICAASDKPVVLMIDEIDSASNNQVFLDFLAQLRAGYIDRDETPAFQSVILAGVYDIKNLKRKLRPEEEHKVNSPWNIAADFTVDLSLSKKGIAEMLKEYEEDYHTGMAVDEIAELLYDYTSGYPFLVSKLCKLIDERISLQKGSKAAAWTIDGFMEANRLLTAESNTLFESLVSKVINYQELNTILQDKIFNGQTVAYTAANPTIHLAAMFGIIKNVNGSVALANKVFAKVLSDYYLSLDEMKSLEIYKTSLQNKNQFIKNGKLDMRLVVEKFIEHFNDLYGHEGEKFIEKEGRKYFILYLRPIINGIGHYSMEAVTASENRTDLIVYYHEEFFILEMKIWRGQKKHEEGEKQLLGYMADYHQNIGFLITFNFNKTKNSGITEVKTEGKTLIEAII